MEIGQNIESKGSHIEQPEDEQGELSTMWLRNQEQIDHVVSTLREFVMKPDEITLQPVHLKNRLYYAVEQQLVIAKSIIDKTLNPPDVSSIITRLSINAEAVMLVADDLEEMEEVTKEEAAFLGRELRNAAQRRVELFNELQDLLSSS
ncbi:MAG: hypothetical protein Q8P90_00290 [bacterium]|nr:hypothetical protein [bacterium]